MSAPRLLRRYIASKILTMIGATFAFFVFLIFMIDFVELLRQAGKYGSVSMPTLVWMTLLRIPAYTEVLMPSAVMVGAITALLMLGRKSELAVMRASGLSVWQILRPGLTVAIVLGVFSVVAYNPLAAMARAEAERVYAKAFGQSSNFLRADNGGLWLRQDGPDGPTIITAAAAANKGLQLTAVTVFAFDREDRFLERVDAASAELNDGFWQLTQVSVSRMGQPAERYDSYNVSTYLTPARAEQALAPVTAVSVFELPSLIEVAEKAGLSATAYHIQYELLVSRPLMLIAMVLLGATVSLRSFRSGGIQTMVIAGLGGGVGFFLLAEVSRQVGAAGLVPPWVAVWVPVSVAILVSTTVLLHQEDG